MRIVLDSNVLLVVVGRKSRYRSIWNAFLEGKYQLLVSEEIVHSMKKYFSDFQLQMLLIW